MQKKNVKANSGEENCAPTCSRYTAGTLPAIRNDLLNPQANVLHVVMKKIHPPKKYNNLEGEHPFFLVEKLSLKGSPRYEDAE